MNFVNLVFSLLGGKKTTVGSLTLDALLTETNTYSSEVTEHPVEVGAPISDNIGQKAEKLSIQGVVTGAGVMMFDAGGKAKMIAAKEAIKAIHEQQLPVSIVTGMDVYAPFAMKDCTVTRSDATEKLTVDMTFVKIRVAQPKETDLPPEKVSDKPTGKGKHRGKPAKNKAGQTRQNAGTAKTEKVDNKRKSEIKKIFT